MTGAPRVPQPDIEIAVTTPVGARAAIAGGADRVELCTALELGGLTPSRTMIGEAVDSGIPVHVLIRCRPGGFVYSAEEVAWMADEAARSVAAGAAGVVIGALTAAGRIDTSALGRISAAALDARTSTQVTFHRAIDQLQDPSAHLDDLAAAGVDRVLTSGGAPTAGLGLRAIEAMLARETGIDIMAGGGVTSAHLRPLIALGVQAVHLSAKKAVVQARPGRVSVGSADLGGGTHFETDESLVRDVVQEVQSYAG